MEKKYKISVIIPIYNVEKYLEETILSVIDQTIGFKENIQLILINDGSPDDSYKICNKYKELYPENIIYIEKENEGVSKARNEAKKYAKGELVTFLDSDDKWSKDSFEHVYDFWKQHKDVKVLTCKMEFFDAKKGNHPLNYKYKEDKIIDIRKDYKYIQSSTCSCFFERDTLKNYEYDSTIKYSEDTKLINEILIDNYYMAVLSKPTYYYRRRFEQNSAAQVSAESLAWYKGTPKKVYEYLFDLSKEKFGKVIEYIQYLGAYEIGWRLKIFNPGIEEDCYNEYIDTITKLIKDIDINIFKEQKNISISDELYLLRIKEKFDIKKALKPVGNNIYCERLDEYIRFMYVDDLYVYDNKIYIYAKVDTILYDKSKIKLLVNGKKHKIEFYELKKNVDTIAYNGDNISKYMGVKCVIDLSETKQFGFAYGQTKEYLKLIFSEKAVLNSVLKGSYYTVNNKMLTHNDGIFKVKKNLFVYRFMREIKNILGMLKAKRYKQIIVRCAIKFTKPFRMRNVWLVSDRVNMANDNGEHLFKYLCKNKFKNVRPYFVISKDSKDFNRMKKIGKVVDPNSLKYKWLFIHSKYIISSHAEVYITNIFGKSNKYFVDLFNFKYVFLQHGITINDISPWLNPHTKKIDMFVTAARKEYESILKYGYSKDVVKLTGFTRYDNLVSGNEPKKQILVQPTWRASLASKIDKRTGKRIYNPKFKETEFFKFYNGLINNPRLINYLKEKDYRLRFCPHPNLLVQIEDFDKNELLDIEKGEINYQKEFKEAALLVTDYSSVLFDVAYLKKPIVSAQFDIKTFYEGQIYKKGYFEYEKDGFGPITYDIESTVDTIIEIIDNGAKMDKKYMDRVDNFYYKFDNKNCERVYKEIIKLK